MKMDSYFKWGAILVLGFLIFAFFAFFAKQFGEAALNLKIGDNEISVRTSQLEISSEQITKFDPQTHYIDAQKGFSFELPSEKIWTQPELLRGIDAVLNAKSVTLAAEMQQQLDSYLALSPMGTMLRNVEMLRITSKDSIEIEIIDETTNAFIKATLEKIFQAAGVESTEISQADISDMKRTLIGFEQMIFSNEFTISIFDKSMLEGMPIKTSLPNFCVTFLSSMGYHLDHLVADEQSILAGVSVSIERVKIDGQTTDLRVDRWVIFTENQKAFFLIEIAYSPQTTDSIRIWEQLRNMMDSFHTFES